MRERIDPEITPMQRKGIELAVKGLHKKYPFVIGYKDDEVNEYESSHYIHLILDLHKVSEYLGAPIIPYFEDYVKKGNSDLVYALWSYLKFEDDRLSDIASHPGYILQEELKDLLQTLYKYLPEQFRMRYRFGDDPSYSLENDVNLNANGFYMR